MSVLRSLMIGLALSGLTSTWAGAQDKVTTIDFYYPVSASGPIAQIVQDLIKDFESETPGIKVNAVYAGTFDDVLAKSLTAHKAGKPPAIAHILSVQLPTLLEEDAIVPLEDIRGVGDTGWVKNYFPALMRNGTYNGKTYGLPLQRSTQIWYWNKQAFKDAGLDPDKGPKTWDEVVAFGKKLIQRDDKGNVARWGIVIPSSLTPYWSLQSFTYQAGSDISVSEKKVAFNSPQAVEALTWWRDLGSVHKIMPTGVVEWGTAPRDFVDGKTAMLMTTTGNLGFFRTNAKFEFGAAPLPAKTRAGTPTGGGNMYIFKKAPQDQQLAAAKFAQWMASPKRAAEWAVKTGYIAVVPAAYDDPLMKEYVAKFPQYLVARDQLQTAVRELSTFRFQEIRQAIEPAIQAVMTGEKTPERALADAQTAADTILRPYQ